MDYVHIEDVVTGETECSKVTEMPTGISEADMNAWLDELLIEDKKLRKAGKVCKECGDTKNWCPDFN